MKTLFGRMVNLGFTGTQEGMSPEQRQVVTRILKDIRPTHCHHGDCIGADADFHKIARRITDYMVGHPPTNESKRANCQFDFCLPPKSYLVRNHEIVDCCTVMIATPKEQKEELRSGTWATIRYARKTNTRLIIVYPDGTEGN